MNWLRRANQLIIMILDVLLLAVSLLLALLLRYDFSVTVIPKGLFSVSSVYYTVEAVETLAIFAVGGLYRYVWRFIGSREIYRIFFFGVLTGVLNIAASLYFGYALPINVMLIHQLIRLFFCIGIRYSYRLLRQISEKHKKGNACRIMIIGAGGAAHMLLRELLNSNMIYNNKICCLIDDNPAKKGRSLEGIPIVGGCEEIADAVKKYRIDIIVISIPTLGAERRKEIIKICQDTGCRVQTVPGIYQLLNGEVGLSNLRSVEHDHLLEREPVRVDQEGIGAYVKDKTVLVTGGGGSIGSELCRQLAVFGPRRLIVVDIYENNAYDIQQELLRQFPALDLQVLIASVRDAKRMEQIFKDHRPELVYHAAAHKHVPLMEESPNEAIKNNVMGTCHVARLAVEYSAERFVLISSDKAVNPTNIMGASKRLCEMVVQNVANAGKTRFATVRFGNVMGSNGSVIPLFEKQIEAGGPVTVTHPDVIRYFMTIPEAVALVLQAGAYATPQGNIFVLDMGMPIKIDDLARNLIRLHGLVPEQDIQICYTGLRPGEKLYEELLLKEEGLETTANKLIFVGAPIQLDQEHFEADLKELCYAAENNAENITDYLKKLVPSYCPNKK